MKKTIITTAICYILFEVIFYFAIAFTNLSLDPFFWSEHARSGFAFFSMIALVICGIIIIAFKPEK